MASIGIDIGTTSISAVLADSNNGKVLRNITVSNKTDMSLNGEGSLQDPERIFEKVKRVIDEFLEQNNVECIGISCQMHGIVYVSLSGKNISPLYTWRHEGGNEAYEDTTYAGYLSAMTGYMMASGYGFTTMFYHKEKGVLPKDFSFCSIGDYVSLRLTGESKAVVHVSNAHSFGLFDLNKKDFDKEAIEKAGVDIQLPEVTSSSRIIGSYKGIPVSVAIGDNQASFLGSVSDMENTVLFNMGTGSQISYMSESVAADLNMEVRPLINDLYFQVGCSLCGGDALTVLENFISQIVKDVCNTRMEEYYYINRLIDRVLQINEPSPLEISTLFKGTRANPDLRGSIANITMDNFTPENLLYGFIQGMVNELYGLYEGTGRKFTKLVGAGNGIVKNLLIQRVLKDRSGMEVFIPVNKEQTAYGAALFSMYSVGLCTTMDECQRFIEYK